MLNIIPENPVRKTLIATILVLASTCGVISSKHNQTIDDRGSTVDSEESCDKYVERLILQANR